ncbi:hypothetical protein ASPCAL00929 [Aspergillus calidoustus]|uniref:Uncharacterized protein n=1 Tax=Aspergillus calidoustus TaxID=454130 RepID=A0A0U5FPF1_ASPCI|nr:hypothetical protein ASPCAL00929 [Aspergillus calidoustus]
MSNPQSTKKTDPYSPSLQPIGEPPRHSYQYPSGDVTTETQDQPHFLNLTEPHVGQSNEFTHYGQGQARFENMGTQADYACGFSTGSWYKEGVGMESGAIRGQKPGEKTGEDTGERSEGVTDDF